MEYIHSCLCVQKSGSSKLDGTTCGQVLQLQVETTCLGDWKKALEATFYVHRQGALCLPTTIIDNYSNP